MVLHIRTTIVYYLISFVVLTFSNFLIFADAQIPSEIYLAWNPNGQIISVSQNYSIDIVDAINGNILNTISSTDLQFSPTHWSADGTLLAIMSDSEVQIWSEVWNPLTASIISTIPSLEDPIWITAWHPVNQYLAVGNLTNVFVYHAGNLLYSVDHESSLSDIKWSNNGEYLVTSGGTGVAGEVRVWDGSDGEFIYNIRIDTQLPPPNQTASGASISWNPDDTQLIIGCDDGIARIWDLTTATPISVARFAFNNDNSVITTVDWHPNGFWIVSSSVDGAIRIWDAITFELLDTVQTNSPIYSVAWSPDGTQLAYGTTGGNGIEIVPAPSPSNGASVDSFALINADTDMQIVGYEDIQDGVVIDVSSLPTTNLNIEATVSGDVESVVWGLNANPSYATESTAPYSLGGNNGSDYLSWAYTLDQPYSLTATPYSGDNGTGTAGTARTISFTLVDNSSSSSCGGLVQEGEDGTIVSGFEVMSDPTASGGQYMAIPEAISNDYSGNSLHHVRYCFTVTTAGVYNLRGMVRGIDSSHDSFFVNYEGDQHVWYMPIVNDYEMNYYGGSNNPYDFSLDAGEHEFVVVHRERGSRLDTIELELDTPINTTTAIYRINVGGGQYTDSVGNVWEADNYFTDGRANDFIPSPINGTTDDDLYSTERSGGGGQTQFSYALPVVNGTYTVRLHFAELWWVPGRGGSGTGGERVFDVQIEGTTVLDDYDIISAVLAGGNVPGYLRAQVEEFTVTVTDGVLNLNFPPGSVDHPNLVAIEVVQ